MHISLYTIYVGACLLAIAAAILSGVVLLNTFAGQQKQSEDAQINAGEGQVRAMQSMIRNQMMRMETISDDVSRQLMLFIRKLPKDGLLPENAIQSLNETIFTRWAPSVRAVNSLNGYGLTLMYVNETTGAHFDRTFWVYWDLKRSGDYVYVYAYTSPADDLCHAYHTFWLDYSDLQLGDEMYVFDTNAFAANIYKNNDFFDFAQPWSAVDGYSYWYFTHMRAFQSHGVYINIQAWDVGISWLDMMTNVLLPGASFVAFDSQGYVMAATNADELRRISLCQGSWVDGTVAADCINSFAGSHPVSEIRAVYNQLHQLSWDDLAAPPVPPQVTDLTLQGKTCMAIAATLFSKDHFRVTIVWYQPWAKLQANATSLTALICILTVFSTFVLTLLGIFGVLRPLTSLGTAMKAVAWTLKEGDGQSEAVLKPRKRSVFQEVDAIGRDFETIVVDFLGFSSTNSRDNRYAPRDPGRPFAVLFTDIQASTRLWGRDPAEMSRCVQVHHELIRRLIQDHHLYEVKTVGDCFMVTTTSASDALRFALDIQTVFYNYDWDWDGADLLYRETTLAFEKVEPGLLSMPGPEYYKLWNGLRVRVGIHYGMGVVRYDVVSKGFDYYGTVVNTAARIEAISHGGQIVVSQDLMGALQVPLDPSVGLAVALGTFPLRGVLEPPALVEIRPASLQGRRFPPLRLEHGGEEVEVRSLISSRSQHRVSWDRHSSADPPLATEANRNSVLSGQSQVSDRGTLAVVAEELARGHVMVRNSTLTAEVVSQQLVVLYHIVEDLLRPLALQHYCTVTKVLAQGWGVLPPKSKADFEGSGMRLVLRMSETTMVLSRFTAVAPHIPWYRECATPAED